MQNVLEIYKKYKIMPNLVDHQLRVAGVAMQICDAIDDKNIEKDTLLKACLFHDMGNIIKFDLSYFPDFLEPLGLEYWESVKKEYIDKYGNDEHHATNLIIKELGLSEKVSQLADQSRFSLLCEHVNVDDFNIKLIHYADSRVGPNGILSYKERMEDAKVRYQNNDQKSYEEKRKKLDDCGKEIEKQIFSICKISPEDINDISVAKYIEKIKNTKI